MRQRAAGSRRVPPHGPGLDGHLRPTIRITFLCPHVRIAGGVRAILTYADRLAARGHDVELVVPAKSRPRAWWRNAGRIGVDWMPGFRARVRWVPRWTPDVLRDADAVIATAWQSAPVAADAPPRCGRTFYLVQHYESLYHGAPERVDATYRLPLRKIVISTWLRDIMRDRFASDAEVLVTPVDRALFHPVPTRVTTPRPRVLMLHHDYAWKGVTDGFEAVGRARPRVPGLTLVGFGVKPPRGPVRYDEFHANPPQGRLAELYSGCDIYLCPSWDEGLGMPPMEAMACGAALVTYDNGGCRDYARDGETALVAPRRDVGALAMALERAATDAALRAKLARAGRDFVVTAFDWDRAVARMESLLDER
ncbi:MAG: glycosyltransferase family 4 protein [Candidatus Rokubacteria bacterium]|nr:glycosyltransferase family 4 protein [Candidatus Rokubacteria bacterium]